MKRNRKPTGLLQPMGASSMDHFKRDLEAQQHMTPMQRIASDARWILRRYDPIRRKDAQ